jgi:hypothetical protein
MFNEMFLALGQCISSSVRIWLIVYLVNIDEGHTLQTIGKKNESILSSGGAWCTSHEHHGRSIRTHDSSSNQDLN